MTMTRRGFLSASAAFAAGSAGVRGAWSAPLPREADIVVIGAGAAGIAAARRIMAANRKVLVVEASSQVGGRYARAGETEEFLAALVRANRAIDDASRGKVDVSCAAALPKDLGDWVGTADFVLGASATGKDLKDLSAVDKTRAQDRSAAIASRKGLGTLVAKLGEQVPISVSTPVSRIAWSNRDVTVETPSG